MLVTKKLWFAVSVSVFLVVGCGEFQKKKKKNNGGPPPTVTAPSPNSPDKVSDQDLVKTCQDQMNRWRGSHATTTPFSTFNKLTSLKLSQSELAEVMEGETNVKLPEPVDMGGFIVDALDVSQLAVAKTMDAAAMRIKRNMVANVALRGQNELLIMHAGLTHVLDFYVAGNDDVSYAGYPLSSASQFKTPEVSEMFARMGSPEKPEDASAVVGASLLATYGRLFYHSNKGGTFKRPASELLSDKAAGSNAIVIADIHGIRETAAADSLPEARCITPLGLQRVKVALETDKLMFGKTYTWEEVYKSFDFKANMPASTLSKMKEQFPEAYQILESGKAQVYPNIMALLAKLKTYADAGITIEFGGL